MTRRVTLVTLAALALAFGSAQPTLPIELPADPIFDRAVTLVARGNLTLEEGFELLADAIGYTIFTRGLPDTTLDYDFEEPRPAHQVLTLLLRLYGLGAQTVDDVLMIAPPATLASFARPDAAPPSETREYLATDPQTAIAALALLHPTATTRYLESVDTLYVTAPWTEHEAIGALLATLDDRLRQESDERARGFTTEIYELPEGVEGLEDLLASVDARIDAVVLGEVGLVRVSMPTDVVDAVERVIERVIERHAASAPTRVTYTVDNATATALQAQLQTALEARDLPVTLIGDNRTNTLTAIAAAEGHAIIEELLSDLDQRERQVRIRVRIHEISKNEASRLGIDLSGRVGVFGIGVGGSGLSLAFTPGGTLSPLTINGVLDALEQQSLARSIDDANLLTLNNQVASLTSGGTIRLLATEESEGQEIEFGTLVRVQPRISSDGFVTVAIDIELSGFESEVSGGLRFAEQRITNTVQVPDGGVVILGGLIRQGVVVSDGGVPLLRSLPVIGALFRTTSETREESELIVTLEVNVEEPVAPELALLDTGTP